MTRRFPILLAAAAGAMVLASATSLAQAPAAKGAAGGADAKFAMDAAKGGMMEVEMGRMAVAQASSADVKQFGQKMVDDHSKANDELKGIASQKGMTLPSAIDAAGKAKMDKMAKLSGAAFDKAYMADMVADHKKDVAEFRKEASSGKDADIKGFAGKTLPTLEDHLKMAQDTNAKVAGAAHQH
jgi:putative membrane protein